MISNKWGEKRAKPGVKLRGGGGNNFACLAAQKNQEQIAKQNGKVDPDFLKTTKEFWDECKGITTAGRNRRTQKRRR